MFELTKKIRDRLDSIENNREDHSVCMGEYYTICLTLAESMKTFDRLEELQEAAELILTHGRKCV